MEVGNCPRVQTSQKNVRYRRSMWRVHQFEIWCGQFVCTAAVLRVQGAVLVWIGVGEPRLGALALGVPGAVTALLGGDGMAPDLARRLATLFAKPVYVCTGAVFDRFTIPLVEQGLIAEIKSRPECF